MLQILPNSLVARLDESRDDYNFWSDLYKRAKKDERSSKRAVLSSIMIGCLL